MFLQFFTSLRDAQVPVTLREYLTLMESLNADLAEQTVENFYYLSRASLVKDERNLDKFDRVFGTVFKGLESLLDAMEKADIPAEWLKKLAEKYLTEEEKKQIEALGWDKLMETLRQRLKEQQGRHQGGNKWIGTAANSRISTATSNSASATSRSHCGGFANSPAPAPPTNSTSTPRSRRPPTTAISTCICAPNGATRSRCWCSSTSAARWIRTSSRSRNCSRRRRPNSSTWNISTSTTASTKASGSRTGGALPTAPRPGTCCINIRTTTRWCSSATPRCRPTKSWSPAARSSMSMKRQDRSGSSASRAPIRTRSGSIR